MFNNSNTQRPIPLLALEKSPYPPPIHTLLCLNKITLHFILIPNRRQGVLEEPTGHTRLITLLFREENSCKIL